MGQLGAPRNPPAGKTETSDQTRSTDERDTYQHQPSARMRIGVSFRNLSCVGKTRSGHSQPTFGSYAFAIPKLFWSGFRPSPTQTVQILQGFHGLVAPGEMLLVLGRPGSGCSTFLKTLAGETQGFDVGTESEINYQGVSFQEMQTTFKGERIYLGELDVHFPELTLGQALDFAASTREKFPQRDTGRVIASKFNLSNAFTTRVGNAVIRGISGGEKRRASIAEAFMSGAQLQCWDNSTRGLDSSTALQIISLLRETSKTRGATVCMSLYQASEEMFTAFDKVVLLYKGRLVYFGPTRSARDYFTSLGFEDPRRSSTPDFLTSLTNPEERVMRKGFDPRSLSSPDDFARAWEQSKQFKELEHQIEIFNSSTSINNDAEGARTVLLGQRTSTYPLSLSRQVHICMIRSFQRTRNNISPSISATIANSILGVIIGSVFYNLGETTDSLQQRATLLFFALLVNAFAPAIEVSLVWAQRPIVEKHHRYAFYHPFTERLATMICDLPSKLALCIGLHTPLYFLSSLRRSGDAFFSYLLFMFANLLTMSMLFRMVGSISRTREQTITPVSILSVLCIIYAGFVVPPASFVPWLGWFWRINPVAYTYESLMINELDGRRFSCSTIVPSGTEYDDIHAEEKICAVVGSNQGQLQVEGTQYLILKYGYVVTHIWRNVGIVLAMMIIFFFIHLLTTEYLSAQPSRGEVLLFKHRFARKVPTATGAETRSVAVSAGDHDEIPDQHVESNIETPSLFSQASVITWTGINYTIKTKDGPRELLSNIDGWIKPGTLTAMMGMTGAGKTTLLNVLANRLSSGIIDGPVFVDGHLRDTSFQRRIGYVQQDDLHLPTATVRESLQFSAFLRQSRHTSKEETRRYVERVLDLLELQHYGDAIVGVPGEGLNVEQRKRLSIALELVAKPGILIFLDEPTSGLDSQTAWSICTLLRKLSNEGQTILCTIHQPSAQLLCMFDRLLLLGNGGKQLYFGDIGPDARTLIEYFERHGARRCLATDNPASWMLEETRTPPPSSTRQEGQELETWSDKWHRSDEKRDMLEQIAALNATALNLQSCNPEADIAEYAASPSRQLKLVTKRMFQDQWRDPIYLYCKTTLAVGLSLVNGISFYHITLSIQGLISLLFSIFLITQLFGSIDRLVILRFVSGRDLFEARERDSKTYSWYVFVAANVLVEVTWQTLVSVPVFAAWYYATGLERNGDADFGTAERGALTFVLIWLFNLWATTLSQAVAASFQQAESAMQVASLLFWLCLVFCGVLVPPDQLPRFWIFLYRVSPLTYFLEGLAVAGLANTHVECSSIETLRVVQPQRSPAAGTCGEYLAPYIHNWGGYVVNGDDREDCLYCPVSDANKILHGFGMDVKNAWRDVGFMAAYVLFTMAITFVMYGLARVPRRKE